MSVLSRRSFTVMSPHNLPHREVTRANDTPDNIRAPRVRSQRGRVGRLHLRHARTRANPFAAFAQTLRIPEFT